MRILLIGGTGFLGRHLTEAALHKGHEVTLFHRTPSKDPLFDSSEHVYQDRDLGFDVLGSRHFDAVIDVWGTEPSQVAQAARFFHGRTSHFTYISSVSVYRDFSKSGVSESDPCYEIPASHDAFSDSLGVTPPPSDSPLHYGQQKFLSEEMVRGIFGKNALIVRPGLLVGPYDHSDRFSYWIDRLERGGEVLTPVSPDYRVQFLDARDLAHWILQSIEKNLMGCFNAVGPQEPQKFGDLIEWTRSLSSKEIVPRWASEPQLLAHDVSPWIEFPLWMVEAMQGIHSVDASAARAHGLSFRPAYETFLDTRAWLSQRPQDHSWEAGLSSLKESSILKSLGKPE